MLGGQICVYPGKELMVGVLVISWAKWSPLGLGVVVANGGFVGGIAWWQVSQSLVEVPSSWPPLWVVQMMWGFQELHLLQWKGHGVSGCSGVPMVRPQAVQRGLTVLAEGSK